MYDVPNQVYCKIFWLDILIVCLVTTGIQLLPSILTYIPFPFKPRYYFEIKN